MKVRRNEAVPTKEILTSKKHSAGPWDHSFRLENKVWLGDHSLEKVHQ